MKTSNIFNLKYKICVSPKLLFLLIFCYQSLQGKLHNFFFIYVKNKRENNIQYKENSNNILLENVTGF